jgi:chromosome segregation ATPase
VENSLSSLSLLSIPSSRIRYGEHVLVSLCVLVDEKERPTSATGFRIQTFSPRPSSSSERGFLTPTKDQRDWSKPETFGLSMGARERRDELEARLQELTVPQSSSADAMKDKTKVIHELIGMTKYLRRDNELVHSQLEKQVELTEELRRENSGLREEIGTLRAKASRLSSTGYVPSPDRLDELQESINEIREEIKRNDLGQMRKDIPARLGSASTMSIEEGGAYEHLLLTKFEVLEQLIVVLKKRIEVLEEMEHRMKDVANEYGSLQALMDTEKQLRKVWHLHSNYYSYL